MRILITGATGFVGKHLYSRLKKEHELFVLTRDTSDSTVISPEHEVVFTGDIDFIAEYMLKNKIEGVIHLATKYVSEHKCHDIKDMILSNIYLGTAILEASSKAGVKWFINVGTIWQNYNVPDYSDEYCPVNLYAATKQAFMTIAKYYTETFGIRFCTLKLCDTFGPNDTRRKIIDLFGEISRNGTKLDMSPGEQLIDIVHIDTVCSEFEKLIGLMSTPDEELRDEYVVTSGMHKSLRQLASEYETENNVKLNINWGGKPYRQREVMRPYIGNIIPNETKKWI